MAEETTTKTKKEVILVNNEKRNRALNIIALVTGKKEPTHSTDVDRKDKWANILAEAKVKADGPDALGFIYEKLGGLTRTHEEQVEVEKKAAKAKAAAKKKPAKK